MDFESFIEPLRENLETYRAAVKAKKADAKTTNTESEDAVEESETDPPVD